MKPEYSINWVPATPEYILASLREEWRQCALIEGEQPDDIERELPAFAVTVHEWRETLDLLGWRALGRALNESWGTRFTPDQWFSVLEPARERTLRGVCELLATQALRPVVPPARLLGHECAAAGVFLAIRSLLVQAGAPPQLRPSTPLESFLQKWPEVFLTQISRLSPGGLSFTRKQEFLTAVVVLSYILAALLTLLGLLAKDPWLPIAGLALFGLGWIGAGCGRWFQGSLEMDSVTDFRGLTEVIMTQQSRAGLGPVESS